MYYLVYFLGCNSFRVLFSGSLSLFHHVDTVKVNALQPVSCWMPRLHFICRRDLPSYNPSRPIAIWNKRGFVCLLLPFTDLTICVDVERNPGPCCSLLNNTTHSTTNFYRDIRNIVNFLAYHTRGISYCFFVIGVSTAVRLHFWAS